MTKNMHRPLSPEGSSDGVEASRKRRNASLANLCDDGSEQLLTDYARAEAEGMKLSPTLTMARGYAEGYRNAAKTGQS